MTDPNSDAFDGGEPATATGAWSGTGLTITVSGDIDFSTALAVRTALEKLLGGVTGGQVGLNLAGVGFCDVAGLRILIGVQQRAAARGATCRIRGIPPHLEWLLQATGTTAALEGAGASTADTRRDRRHRSRPRGKPDGNTAPSR